MAKVRSWPSAIKACLKCGVIAYEAAYAGRGLCSSCYGVERANNSLHLWSCQNFTIRNLGNTALRACMTVGRTQVSRDLGFTVKQLSTWVHTGPPKRYAKVFQDYVDKLLEFESTEEPTEERHELFPEECTETHNPWAIVDEPTWSI